MDDPYKHSFLVNLSDSHYQADKHTGQITHLSEHEALNIACGIVDTDPFIQTTKNPCSWIHFKVTPRVRPPLPGWAKKETRRER
jgi:hypothetical protein